MARKKRIYPLEPRPPSMTMDRLNNFWHTYNGSNTVFIFIHGIFSDSHSCWRHGNPRDREQVFWPDLIRSDRRLGGPSIYLAGYYTAFDAGDFPVAQCAREVLDALRRPDVDDRLPVLDRRRLVFICHSTGGIVARYMLEKYRDVFAEKAVGLALIASPSLGSGWANLASLAAHYYNQRLGLQLRWNNAELEDIHWRFRDLVAQKDALMPGLFGMEAAEHTMIYRSRIPAWIRWILPPRIKVVTTLSAGQYFGAVKILPGTNHFTTVKPDSVNHPSHEFLVDFTIGFRAASDKVASLLTVREPAGTSAVTTISNDRAGRRSENWPTERDSKLPSHEFFAEGGFESLSKIAVVGCVTVEDLKGFESRFEAGIADIMHDPYFLAVPRIMEALRARKLSYGSVDPELRARIVELFADLIFEAYVCFGKRESGVTAEGVYTALSTSLLFQRLRACGSQPVTLSLAQTAQNREPIIFNILDSCVKRIKRVDRQDVTASLRVGKIDEAGCILAEYVSAIVLERLRSPDTLAARAFERIHPTKLRLMHDVDSGEFFSRKRPFEG
jgi:pimeloyl-ACP methyl ester carboxylesterase